MNKKGFTLIELIAVILILGVLMLIAIPSVASYVNGARKSTYVTNIIQLIKGTEALINKNQIEIDDEETTYYVPSTCVLTEEGEAKSPYGKFDPAYVVVTFDGDNYHYYYTGRDEKGMGVPFITSSKKLTEDSIVSNVQSIDSTIGLKGKSSIIVFNEDCTEVEYDNFATMSVSGEGTNDVIEDSEDETCQIQKCRKSYTGTIYWALQDTDNDGKNDRLIISDSEVKGNKQGEFAGNTVFKSQMEVPWNSASTNKFDAEDNLSYYVNTVIVKGHVAPTSTAFWFHEVGMRAKSFYADLSHLMMCHVTSMYSMFRYTAFHLSKITVVGMCSWNTSKVTNMANLFYCARISHFDLSNWDTSKVTTMSCMFIGSGSYDKEFYIDARGWDVSKVKNMYHTFASTGSSRYTKSWEVAGLEDWNVSSAVDMSCMFASAAQDVDSLDIDLSNWNVSSATNISTMFAKFGYYAKSVDLDLTGWNTSNVKNMMETFICFGQKAKHYSLKVSGWDTSNVTTMHHMFMYSGEEATDLKIDLSGWNTSRVNDMSGLFTEVGENSTNFELNLTGWDFSHAYDFDFVFGSVGLNATNWKVIVSNANRGVLSTTPTTIYGYNSDKVAHPPEGREFTLV